MRRVLVVLVAAAIAVASCGTPERTPPVGGTAAPSGQSAPVATSVPTATPTPTTAASEAASPPLPEPSATPGATQGPEGELVRSGVARAAVLPAAAINVARAINAFGLDLLRAIKAPGNAVISPTSVVLALGMARAGARGATAAEIDSVLRAGDLGQLESGLHSLQQELAARSLTVTDENGDAHQVALEIANQQFAQRGLAIRPDYLDLLASGFGAGLRLVDYRGDPVAARAAVNRWTGTATHGRIPELLAPADVTTLTRLILVNTIYLKAPWAFRFFDPKDTRASGFMLANGSLVSIPMMSYAPGGLDPYLDYAAGTGWRAVELPYLGGPDQNRSLALTLSVPDHLAAFEKTLTGVQLGAIVSALRSRKVALTMPKFAIDTHANLNLALQALGIHRAFDVYQADFSGITGDEPLYVGGVIHQANISVDEKGTEAAAATAIVMATGGPGDSAKPIALRIDRPFLFALRDTQTGAVLFLGRITDPSAR